MGLDPLPVDFTSDTLANLFDLLEAIPAHPHETFTLEQLDHLAKAASYFRAHTVGAWIKDQKRAHDPWKILAYASRVGDVPFAKEAIRRLPLSKPQTEGSPPSFWTQCAQIEPHWQLELVKRLYPNLVLATSQPVGHRQPAWSKPSIFTLEDLIKAADEFDPPNRMCEHFVVLRES